MNLLEHYIEEVHSVTDIGNGYVEVIVTCDCYGDVRKYTHRTTASMWEVEQKQGFYIG